MKKALILLLLTVMRVDAQTTEGEKVIHGKIVSESAFVSGIEIVNLNNEKIAKTNENGDFFILAKANDVLVFSAKEFEFKRYVIEDEDLVSEIMIIKMIPKIIEIEAVTVEKHPEINAVSMGILEKEAKHYTPAERKLKTAGDFKAYHLLALLGGGMPLDPVINAINGRTKRLKKQVKIEKKEFLLAQIEELYEEGFYVETLKIPIDYVKGFQYYLIENDRFVKILKLNNSAMTTFVIGELAAEYKEMIACED